jgi:hypothetical protein
MGLVVLLLLVFPVIATDSSDQLNSAGALYSRSVDLANAGNYTEALQVSDQALALNVTSRSSRQTVPGSWLCWEDMMKRSPQPT